MPELSGMELANVLVKLIGKQVDHSRISFDFISIALSC